MYRLCVETVVSLRFWTAFISADASTFAAWLRPETKLDTWEHR